MDTLTKAARQKTDLADRLLEQLIGFWSGIPEFADEWASRDEDDRRDFIEDWPVIEGKLTDLREWNEAGSLSEEQQRRFAELSRYVEQYRETMNRLFQE